MKQLIVLTALALGTAMAQHAVACEYNHEANATPLIVATTEEPTTQTSTQPTTSEPIAPKLKLTDEQGKPATVAGCANNDC